jgi:glycosyltransferase involved in cell wall biosynthesis
MNVAFYIPVLNVGGAEKVVINLLNHLNLKKNNNYFIITDKKNSSWISELNSDVKILNLDSQKNLFTKIVLLKNVLKANNINLVVSHLTHSNLHCLILKIFFQFKLIIVEHNITSKYIDDLGWKSFIFKYLITRFFPVANGIVCVSNSSKNDLVNTFGICEDKCCVIYNPFDFENISKKSLEVIDNEFTAKLIGQKYIVTVARLEIQKNHLFLIDSLKDHLIQNDLKLVLVGGGSNYAMLLDYVKQNGLSNYIYITNYESNPYPYIKNASALVHPARFEGFGLVLIEALYLGIPVVSMNFDVAYEILDNSKLGCIVSDTKSLLKAIENIDNLPLPNKKIVYEKYNLINIVNQYESLFLNY